MSTDLRHRQQRGLTLVELVIFIVIIGIAVAGVLSVMTYTGRNSADPQLRKQALAIAEGLLEEVQAARFTYCDPLDAVAETANSPGACSTTQEKVGPESGNSRPYDNVNDYVSAFGVFQNAFNNAAGKLVDVAGNPMLTTGAYDATLMLTATDGLNDIASDITPDNLKVLRISVNVSYNSGRESVMLEAYRTRYAPNFLP
jgi:MSHA pilin protein MshD